MEMKKVLKYAMEIGECMLVSGAGVSRVEDTISRICKAYGAKEANVFSITSSIVTTIEDEKGEILTQTKRIRSFKTDFTKLCHTCQECKLDITILCFQCSIKRLQNIPELSLQFLITDGLQYGLIIFINQNNHSLSYFLTGTLNDTGKT